MLRKGAENGLTPKRLRTGKPFVLNGLIPPGGDGEDRTPDLLHAMQALSQLSYVPGGRTWYRSNYREWTGARSAPSSGGAEPAALRRCPAGIAVVP